MFLLTAWSLFLLPFSKTLSETGWIAALFLWCAHKIRKKEPLFRLDPLNIAALLFLASVFLSWIAADGSFLPQSSRGLWRWAKYIAIFWMCRDLLRAPEARRQFVRFFLISMALVTLNGLYQMWHGVDLVKNYAVDIPGRLVRMKSSFPSPNDLASFYLLALPIIFVAWIGQKRWSIKAAGLAALAGIFFMGFTMTFSRSAFLALGGATALYLVLTGRKKALTLTVLGALFFLGSSSVLRENFLTSLSPVDETIAERLRYWRDSTAILAERPVLGHGPNTYFAIFSSRSPAGETYRGYAHNFTIQMWSDLGISGLALFLFLFFWRYLRPPPRSGIQAALWVGLLGFWVQGLADTNFFAFQTSHLFWAFWGMLNAAERSEEPDHA